MAADTRVTRYSSMLGPPIYEDDNKKVHKTSLGVITGAGSVELINLVNNRLNKIDEIMDPDQILDIINKERNNYRASHPEVPEQYIENTGWLFSYFAINESKQTAAFRLAFIHPSIEPIIGQRYAVWNHPYVIHPYETLANPSEAEYIDDSLKKLIKPIEEFDSLDDTVQYHGLQIADLIQEISPKYSSISSSCQIGVQAHTSDKPPYIHPGVSTIIKPGDTKVSIQWY